MRRDQLSGNSDENYSFRSVGEERISPIPAAFDGGHRDASPGSRSVRCNQRSGNRDENAASRNVGVESFDLAEFILGHVDRLCVGVEEQNFLLLQRIILSFPGMERIF